MRILVTRPAPEGQALVDALKEMGAEPIYFPTLTIVANDPNLFSQTSLVAFELIIFISKHAVRHSRVPFRQSLLAYTGRIGAMGEGTAALLAEKGVPVDIIAHPQSTEGLLDNLSKLNAPIKRVLLIKGQGGKPELKLALESKAIVVEEANVYQRIPVVADAERLNAIFSQPIDVVMASSGETLKNLYKLVHKAQLATIQCTPLVVVSESMVALAKSLGATGKIICAETPQNLALCKAAMMVGVAQ